MGDIVERLNNVQAALDREGDLTITQTSDFWIDDARKEIERLRAALRKIMEPITIAADAETVTACQDLHELIRDIADQALSGATSDLEVTPTHHARP